MSDVNNVVVVGRLAEKPALKYGASGTAVTNLRIANNVYMGSGKAEKVNWFTVVVFGKQAENCEKYLDKGRQVIVTGRLDWNSWEGKDGQKKSKVQIVANAVQFIGGGKQGQGAAAPDRSPESEAPQENSNPPAEASNDFNSTFESPIDDTDDIPF